MLSIIIPTLNEEKYLPLLLESIKKQNFKDYEIILADAGSKDKTIEIAKKYGCLVVPGGLPSKGRNEGAKASKGDLLLFLDADVIILKEDFLEKAVQKFHDKKLGVATFSYLYAGAGIYRFLSRFYNFWVMITQKFLPHAIGALILVEKKVHNDINGFDETIIFCEDVQYVIEASKVAKFGLLKVDSLLLSNRRFVRDGIIKSCIKYVLAELHIIFLGPIKTDIFKYRFAHYEDKGETKTNS